jgi:hypothetical protein
MNPEQLEEIGQLIDRLDNLCSAMELPMPAELHLKALKESLPNVRDDLQLIYIDAGGENHWE